MSEYIALVLAILSLVGSLVTLGYQFYLEHQLNKLIDKYTYKKEK